MTNRVKLSVHDGDYVFVPYGVQQPGLTKGYGIRRPVHMNHLLKAGTVETSVVGYVGKAVGAAVDLTNVCICRLADNGRIPL